MKKHNCQSSVKTKITAVFAPLFPSEQQECVLFSKRPIAKKSVATLAVNLQTNAFLSKALIV